MKEFFSVLAAGALIFAFAADLSAEESLLTEMKHNETNMEGVAMKKENDVIEKGAMTPQGALAYMKSVPDLVIVDVAASRHYKNKHFEGAVNIPIEELTGEEQEALFMEIPAGRPVLLHCRLGMIVPGAYRHILELRSDIPEIGYINGAPLFDEYNEWLSGQKAKP